jgi:hypothetical protein
VSRAERDREPFSAQAVQRQVLAEALQHPTTLYPFAAGALAATYAVFFGPALGGGPAALLVGMGCGLGAAASFTWRYFVQGERVAREKAQQAIAEAESRRRETLSRELSGLRAELQLGFEDVRSSAGLKNLIQLERNYQELSEALREQTELDVLATIRLEESAAETYRQGMQALGAALDLIRAVQVTDPEGLRAEIQELEEEIAELQRDSAHPERVRIKQEMLASHQKRVALVADHAVRVERLMQQADESEAALERARVTLAGMDSSLTRDDAREVSAALDRTVESIVQVRQAVEQHVGDQRLRS